MKRNFEKRFSGEWVSSTWFEVDKSPVIRKEKSIAELEKELEVLNENIFNIEQRQRMLKNLSKLYE